MHAAESPILIHTDIFQFLGFYNFINGWTVTLLVVLLTLLMLHVATRNPKWVPSGIQNFMEMVLEWVNSFAEPLVGKNTPFFLPLFMWLFLFIFFSNLIGLIPGFLSPTSRVDTNLGLATVVFLSTHLFGVKQKGLKGYLSHFLPPALPKQDNFFMGLLMGAIQLFLLVLMPFVHVVGELARPLSLTMRLFGNIMAKEKLLAVLALLVVIFWPISAFTKVLAVVPFVLRALIVVLGIFVSFVQGLVFMLLAMVYIGGAVMEHEDHGEESGEAHAPAHGH
jgi:F-type H+-transporting ATPase subunit a